MKKIIALLLVSVIALSLSACKSDDNKENPVSSADTSQAAGGSDGVVTTKASDYKSSGKSSGKSFEPVINSNEYVLYNNIFYNKQGGEYDGKPVIKEGTFATLYDEYNGVTRYYVWGYYDNTKCCDWQWEIKPDSTDNLPDNGSLVSVTGTFVSDENALDGYWIINPEIKTKKPFNAPEEDIVMSTMSATLERVEALNLLNKGEGFEGKSIICYGRVLTPNSIQSPYYNNDYEIPVETKDEMPAIGMMVLVSGKVEGGKIVNAKVELTEDY